LRQTFRTGVKNSAIFIKVDIILIETNLKISIK
jgi:hypothetical protein